MRMLQPPDWAVPKGYANGVAARGTTIVVTSSGHCATPGSLAYEPDGVTVRGVFGPAARSPTCPHPGHECAASDINALDIAPDRIPWGRLNLVDMGTGGYREIAPGTRPLACDDIAPAQRFVVYPGRERFPLPGGTEAIDLVSLCKMLRAEQG